MLTINFNRRGKKNLQLISNLALFSSLFSLHDDEAYYCKPGAMTTIKRSPGVNVLDNESTATHSGLARDLGTRAVPWRKRHSLHQNLPDLKRAGISTWREFCSYCFLSQPSHQLCDLFPHFLGHKCPKSRNNTCFGASRSPLTFKQLMLRSWPVSKGMESIKSSLSFLVSPNLTSSGSGIPHSPMEKWTMSWTSTCLGDSNLPLQESVCSPQLLALNSRVRYNVRKGDGYKRKGS